MRAYSSMPTEDFVYQIRQIAIGAQASPLVIDQIDAIVAAPSEDEIEKQCEEARDEGDSEGRGVQWEMCFDALESLRRDDPDNIGLTKTQVEQILETLIRIKPEWLK